ncbi:V-type proton ATPase 116 kDa subunit a-like isoform X2 [Stylophora pistillata]|uniref:V-type proton ATPase 116 kDa subunit a-like isoform X2 n=1 Tax=Stylophora pistillata TaxID=50429 RepID=UPI000C05000E|nr:V-type proton ATPase 116 kDa subunit a-like isoform X2 [Stylophora pistillata]
MSSLFRSEEMTLAQLFLQAEAAYTCVSELGELSLVQFRDLNPDVNAFQRKFVNEVRRCEEMERKLRFLYKEIEKADIQVSEAEEYPETPQLREMTGLEAQFEQLENEMKDSNTNHEHLMKSFLQLTEFKHILSKTQTFFEEAALEGSQHLIHEAQSGDLHALLEDNAGLYEMGKETQLGFVTGVIGREQVPSFERLLWRSCYGNVLFKQAEIETPLEDPSTGHQVKKCVFIAFFQGDQLRSRVMKICEGYHASIYPCPNTATERLETATKVDTSIEDLQMVLNETRDHRYGLLTTLAKNISQWFIKVKKIKAIYHTMNMFNLNVTQKCLIAECWCPVSDLDKIQQALRRGTERSGAALPSILNRMATDQEPPTFNRTNKFTRGFQAIVDAYGVANYQEVNPALFTIITFPFLFAIMFGDCGHGLIMFLFALWLVLNEKKLENYKGGGEMFETIFHGRYIILLMGVFAIYTGLIYNDCFSKSFNIFGTAWDLSVDWDNIREKLNNTAVDKNEILVNPNGTYRGVPYFFGIDPIWQLATNKLAFTNSFKMKMSVVIGVAHMMFGVCLNFFNHRHFNRPLDIIAELIPQVLFLFCIFGYLVILIFFKWIVIDCSSEHQPSLLLALINMFLEFGVDIKKENLLYHGQAAVQPLLVVIAMLCVPWMLLVKPLYLRHQHRVNKEQGYQRLRPGSPGTPRPSGEMMDSVVDSGEVVYHDGSLQEDQSPDDHREESCRRYFGTCLFVQLSRLLVGWVLLLPLLYFHFGQSKPLLSCWSWRVCQPSCIRFVCIGSSSRTSFIKEQDVNLNPSPSSRF